MGLDIAAQCDAAADPDAAVDLNRMGSCKTISTSKRLRAGKEIPDVLHKNEQLRADKGAIEAQ